MKYKAQLIIVISILISIYSCKEEFDYNQTTQGLERLVVEAYITDVDSVHTIKLMRSSDYIDPQPPLPATGAIVTVSDGTNTWNFTEFSDGLYKNTLPFFGEIDKKYTLNISYNNEEYTASSVLGDCFDIDATYVIYEDSINYVLMCGQEPAEKDQYYIMKTTVNGQINDSLRNWGYFSDDLINGIYFNFELVAMLDGKETDTIELTFSSVSKEFFDYFTSIVNNTGYEPDPFFSTTPANFKGNISNGGLGFFQASSVKHSKCIRF
jgi:hypothetical protein